LGNGNCGKASDQILLYDGRNL